MLSLYIVSSSVSVVNLAKFAKVLDIKGVIFLFLYLDLAGYFWSFSWNYLSKYH